ncbi:snRNA-activating protein complex subunit 2 [Ctenodactylus gundi]
MKPPQRRRSAPVRYLDEKTGPAAWSLREKRQLLRLLQARRGQPEPDAAELAGDLWSRSEAEIQHMLQQLKGRVVREVIQRVLPGGPHGPRRRRFPTPAPIEVWTDLAEKMTGPLEEALTAGFSQVLTIAATEPLSLLHSKPAKPTKARGKQLLLRRGQEDPSSEAPGPTLETFSSSSEPSGPTPEASGPAPEAPAAGPSAEGDFIVDFEKIYKYLSFLSRSGHGPELSAAESAVVLDLLMSLPEELPLLPCTALAEHMNKTYASLTAPESSPCGGNSGPGAEDREPDSRVPEEPSQGTPQVPEQGTPSELRSAWQAAGICPLNPFLVPLELLCRAAAPAR